MASRTRRRNPLRLLRSSGEVQRFAPAREVLVELAPPRVEPAADATIRGERVAAISARGPSIPRSAVEDYGQSPGARRRVAARRAGLRASHRRGRCPACRGALRESSRGRAGARIGRLQQCAQPVVVVIAPPAFASVPRGAIAAPPLRSTRSAPPPRGGPDRRRSAGRLLLADGRQLCHRTPDLPARGAL